VSWLKKHTQRRVHAEDVGVFKYMDESLRVRLNHEVFTTVLKRHPFFDILRNVDEVAMISVCHQATDELTLKMGHKLFEPGVTATKMYTLVSGTMDYFHMAGGGACHKVAAGSYISEVVLWSEWQHVGACFPTTVCELATVDSERFREVLVSRPDLTHYQLFAREYTQRLQTLSPFTSDIFVADNRMLCLDVATDKLNWLSSSSLLEKLKSPDSPSKSPTKNPFRNHKLTRLQHVYPWKN